MEVQINMWAVAAATVSSMVVGSIWYARNVFGNSWIKLAKVNMSKKRSMIAPMVLTLIVAFATAYVLAHVSYLSNQFFHHSFLQDAVTTAFWMWLGFTAARFITHDAFEGRPATLTFITIGNEFATLMVMGVVIGLFGVK